MSFERISSSITSLITRPTTEEVGVTGPNYLHITEIYYPQPIFFPFSGPSIIPSSATTESSETSAMSAQYQELGEALNQLTDDELEEDWKIDGQIYESARIIASQLMQRSLPAPRIFTHGSNAVVFNWSFGTQSRYMTISKDCISILVTESTRRIGRADYRDLRQDFEKYIAAVWPDKPLSFVLRNSGATVDPYERIF
jgi:hypothetical protein